jgi:hypothetical protein
MLMLVVTSLNEESIEHDNVHGPYLYNTCSYVWQHLSCMELEYNDHVIFLKSRLHL